MSEPVILALDSLNRAHRQTVRALGELARATEYATLGLKNPGDLHRARETLATALVCIQQARDRLSAGAVAATSSGPTGMWGIVAPYRLPMEGMNFGALKLRRAQEDAAAAEKRSAASRKAWKTRKRNSRGAR